MTDDPLARAIAALPREHTPPAGVHGAVMRDVRANRKRVRTTRLFAAAAGIGILALGVWQWPASFTGARGAPTVLHTTNNVTGANGRTSDYSEPQLAWAAVADAVLDSSRWTQREHADPRVRAVAQEIAVWRDALADSARSARWPSSARLSVLHAVRESESALQELRDRLRVLPDNALLLAQADLLRERQLELLHRSRALLDEL